MRLHGDRSAGVQSAEDRMEWAREPGPSSLPRGRVGGVREEPSLVMGNLDSSPASDECMGFGGA